MKGKTLWVCGLLIGLLLIPFICTLTGISGDVQSAEFPAMQKAVHRAGNASDVEMLTAVIEPEIEAIRLNPVFLGCLVALLALFTRKLSSKRARFAIDHPMHLICHTLACKTSHPQQAPPVLK